MAFEKAAEPAYVFNDLLFLLHAFAHTGISTSTLYGNDEGFDSEHKKWHWSSMERNEEGIAKNYLLYEIDVQDRERAI